MIIHDKLGGRVVQLYIPFDFNGKRIEAITLAPLRFGHVIRWNEGAWRTTVELLAELAGVDEAIIRELRYPDADRVMEAFMALLTPELRDDVINGRIPEKRIVDEPTQDLIDPRRVNGGFRQEQGPGEPLPPIDTNPGFDLSEEP